MGKGIGNTIIARIRAFEIPRKLPYGCGMNRFVIFLLCLGLTSFCFGQKKKKAEPAEIPPYADTSGGRENYKLSDETPNEFRLYDFYQRQADYYLSSQEVIPKIIPGYPGLDGGKHGHWGKHNQNNHNDTRWNDAEMGEVVTQVLRSKSDNLTVLKGICVRLGNKRELSTVFDPMTLSYRAVWEGGFLSFDGFRWGTSRNAAVSGKTWFAQPAATMPVGSVYLGYHRFGKRVVFDYQIGETKITDEPWATADGFYRRIDFANEAANLELPFAVGKELHVTITQQDRVETSFDSDAGKLIFKNAKAGASAIVGLSKNEAIPAMEMAVAELNFERKMERRWPVKLEVPGELGEPRSDSAYVVDTLTVPYDNPYNAVMQLSGIAFLENGDALACTLIGDIWKVSFDEKLEKVAWRRFATGFNQPVGIHVDDDGIFVLDRGQIYRLHDKNDDGEVDFYENYANDFGGYDRSHTHTFGLHRTADGSFHFTQRESILRTGPDQKTTLQGWGVRNCMGIGGSDDYFWVAPQEGTWTPTSAIIEVNNGEFYGLPTKAGKAGTIAAPLCFIPRGVDNSTGGMLEITSDKWGPFKGSHIGLSYGSGIHYLILRDAEGSRPQGATVPLEGEFLSGSMRGAFHPSDGQLYLVGLDGWGDYSANDGCLHRVRYTGEDVYKPSGFQVHENGIKIDFTTKLDADSVGDLKRYFAHAWNYEYAKRYGSPEFSVKNPKSIGHDQIAVRSVSLLENGSSIFVEMPAMEPVMQLHVRMHLQAENGSQFKTDLFASPMFPSAHFAGEGLAAPQKGKPNAIALRVVHPSKKSDAIKETGETIEGERELKVEAIGGLQYAQTKLKSKPGEALALRLINTDVMPHNLVIVKPGATKKVGEAGFKMLSDPDAGKKNYVPNLSEVLHHIPVIDPTKDHVLHFRAPKEPGDYPYICTFPGHWMAMQGILEVR
ncbi:plastocyanin/azurin family copper-binding protein [Verrucomicrobiales bacterium]|nr:plastocyanin/azurin family copper-binding protein [Verrucomicrobiales bacterium]